MANENRADEIRIRPATAARWDDVVATFGTKGDPSWCWCQYFVTTGDSYTASAKANTASLHDQVAARASRTRPAGLLAYRDGEPVGWVQLGPVKAFPRVTGNRDRAKAAGQDPENLWRITCLVVPVKHRRSGVARALVAGAVAYARKRGAEVLEAHPVDTNGRRAPSANLYHGVLSTFLDAGFEEVARTGANRPIVRLTV